MSVGFIITELQLLSKNAQPAVVNFSRGLNVITGPSDTGKTYIFQCLNYMLGASTKPKPIKEAEEYDTINLKILTNNGIKYTLQSDLEGGDFIVIFESGKSEKYARKHNPNDNTNISSFFLNLNELTNKKIRINENGKTREISYRDISRFLLVDETRIITDTSPILSGQYTTATAEKSIFKFILSGNDDSGLLEGVSKDEVKHRKGKIEMLTELIASTSLELDQMIDGKDPEDRLGKIEENIINLREEYAQLKGLFSVIDNQRSNISNRLLEVSSQKLYNDELLKRSLILNQQYETDAKRLNSTIEASYLLQHTPIVEQHCPICNHSISPTSVEPELAIVINSCQLEINKLDGLIKEVAASQEILNEENSDYQIEIEDLQGQINKLSEQIDDGLVTQMQKIFDKITEFNGIKVNLEHAMFLKNKISSFEKQKEEISSSLKKKGGKSSNSDILTSTVTNLCTKINAVLTACKYPNSNGNGVSFSEIKNDFVIYGQDRELFGKGFRAIIYAAYLVALQEFIFNKSYSLGPTILDSPLVTYRKPNAEGQEIPIDLAMNFYRYLANNANVEQLIILENEEPPQDILNQINHIKFTQNSSKGRYGFIPSNSNNA